MYLLKQRRNFTKVIESVLSNKLIKMFTTFHLLYHIDGLFRCAHDNIKSIKLFNYYTIFSLTYL